MINKVEEIGGDAMTPERLAEIDDIIEFESDVWKVNDALRELRAHIKAQDAKIAELEADKARLDWLRDKINADVKVERCYSNKDIKSLSHTFKTWEVSVWDLSLNRVCYGESTDLRQAIDNAMGGNNDER